MKRSAANAILAQGVQAGISFVFQALVVRALGLSDYGRFAVMYGILVLASGIATDGTSAPACSGRC
jgi:O-antigen/teichoic acid export membrane protein